MSGPVVVFTLDQDNPERGEIKRFDNLEYAARFVEAQVESGVPSEALTVFKVHELPIVVTYRPVVSLSPVGNAEGEEPAPAGVERKPYEKDGERLSTALERPQDI
jgi:hypothetical protein